MATGKTTVGRALVDELRRPFVDCDEALEARTARTAAQIAADDGLDALHDLEAAVLLDALAHGEPCVVTAAASTIEYDVCLAALREHFVAWLRADIDVLVARARMQEHRPLDEDVAAQLRAQAERRDPLFAAVADVVVDVSDVSAEVATRRIAAALR
jgi:shikimate kinase